MHISPNPISPGLPLRLPILIMTQIVLLLGLLLTIGCRSEKAPAPRRTVLDEAFQRTNDQERWALVERDLPTDVWKTDPRGNQKVNHTRFEREIGLAHSLLANIQLKLEKMSPRELVDSLELAPAWSEGYMPYRQGMPEMVGYYLYRDGNEMIMNELKRRPPSELDSLRGVVDDEHAVFSGISGAHGTVTEFVQGLLP